MTVRSVPFVIYTPKCHCLILLTILLTLMIHMTLYDHQLQVLFTRTYVLLDFFGFSRGGSLTPEFISRVAVIVGIISVNTISFMFTHQLDLQLFSLLGESAGQSLVLVICRASITRTTNFPPQVCAHAYFTPVLTKLLLR